MHITLEVGFSDEEKEFIKSSGAILMQTLLWKQTNTPRRGLRPLSLAEQIKLYGTEVEERTKAEFEVILQSLQHEFVLAELSISTKPEIAMANAPLLQLAWSTFAPQEIGIIDYHAAQRSYQREQVGSINLHSEGSDQRLGQHALYDLTNKYSNIKAEMASSYIREIIAREGGVQLVSSETLIETLKELFVTFFPDKQFLGPQPTPDGGLSFPVRTSDGATHDINDLSSGEKEVLYGYLRLRNLSPKNSVLLLDEPELHLNPRLIKGLPQFYHRHLGRAFNNQIWLLTHSDALLREALSTDDFSVYHMQHSHVTTPGQNQVKRIQISEELESAIISLVGDLASYKPGAKLVLFEGGGDSEFDQYVVGSLFSEFYTTVNAISGGNKSGVRKLHALLESARKKGALPIKIYSVVDRDSDEYTLQSAAEFLKWDVYHIENYLLEPKYILRVLREALGRQLKLPTEKAIFDALRDCALDIMPNLVRSQLEHRSYKKLSSLINTHLDRKVPDIALALREVIEASLEKLRSEIETDYQLTSIQSMEKELRQAYESDIHSNTWISSFPGRDILKRFVLKHVPTMRYEVLRNLIIARMSDEGFRPRGMQVVIDQILTS